MAAQCGSHQRIRKLWPAKCGVIIQRKWRGGENGEVSCGGIISQREAAGSVIIAS